MAPALLGPNEPPPYEILNADATRPLLLVCEHASRRVPDQLHGAYPEMLLDTHYGCDIGTEPLVRQLAESLGARAVIARYSRIVIDCNRRLDDPTLLLADTDLGPVAANSDLSDAELKARVDDIYVPFHAAVGRELRELSSGLSSPVYVAIHSFTPELTGSARPWDMGVMWDADPRLAQRLHESLHQEPGLLIGDNEPYSGKYAADFSVDFHAERAGLANVAIEIRQDHLRTAAGVSAWAVRLATALDELARAPDLAHPVAARPATDFEKEAGLIAAADQARVGAHEGGSRYGG
ncbi:MAG: N-formylglutamate amidohydrolase [Pseudomonadota bacterium]